MGNKNKVLSISALRRPPYALLFFASRVEVRSPQHNLSTGATYSLKPLIVSVNYNTRKETNHPKLIHRLR
jgi:hypothetical protein